MGLLLVVIVLGITCVKLSQWQFHRYDERQHSNEITERNLSADSVAVDTVLSTTHEPSSEDEWQTVRAVGHYDPGHQLAVLYRTQQGAAGVEVVVPLVTRSGAALLVDRGWIPSAANGQRHPDLPRPPSGTVTVTGWARVDSNGSADETKPSDGSVRAISADAIEETVPYQLYDGFVELTKESP
ncbi:MAG: SURF1 family protein, partial [Nocardioidaceae bacterium]